MLTKRKNIRKKSKFKIIFLIQITFGHMAQGSKNQNLKEIHAIGSEIIDVTDGRRTDGRTDDGRILIS